MIQTHAYFFERCIGGVVNVQYEPKSQKYAEDVIADEEMWARTGIAWSASLQDRVSIRHGRPAEFGLPAFRKGLRISPLGFRGRRPCGRCGTMWRTPCASRPLPELKKNGEGGQNAGNKSGSRKAWLQQADSHCANARRPWGDTTARHHVEVSGATLDAHWLHAASGVFFKCGLPPYSRVVPVDASSLALVV